jgi:uncharacterized protein YcfJ
MANIDWRDALVLCGIPQNRVGQFNTALGLADLDDCIELPLSNLKSDFEMVSKNPAYAQIVSIRSVKKCIAFAPVESSCSYATSSSRRLILISKC